MFVFMSVGPSWRPVDSISIESLVVAVWFFMSGSASGFYPRHQCTAMSFPVSNASRMAERQTLLYSSSGSLINVESHCRDDELTVSSVEYSGEIVDISYLR